jgi:hypothetical protein
MNPVIPPYEWPMMPTLPFDHVPGDPAVDDLLAVERGAPGEEIELAARAAGPADAGVHRHVVAGVGVSELTAVVDRDR